jgi:hypothetical protein
MLPSSPFPQIGLLSLPLELHQQIYRYLLCDTEVVDTEINYGQLRRDLDK